MYLTNVHVYCTWEGVVIALRATRRAHVLKRRRGVPACCRYRMSVWPERGSRDVARALFHMVAGKDDNCMANAVRCVRGGLRWLLLSVLTIFVIPPVATDITGKRFVTFISIFGNLCYFKGYSFEKLRSGFRNQRVP
jgi:hypothetical protein